jgi:calcium permeable stress-gated cation channel
MPLALLLLLILVPLNVVDGKNKQGGVKGLNRLSFANVGLSYTNRYWAHLILALFVAIFVCLILRFEL